MTEEFIYTGSDILTPVSPRRAGKSPRFPGLDSALLFNANATESVDRTVALYCIQNEALSFNKFRPHAEWEMGDLYGIKAAAVSEWSVAGLLAPPASSPAQLEDAPPAQLEDALEDLKECQTEAHEQSFLTPTPVALAQCRAITRNNVPDLAAPF